MKRTWCCTLAAAMLLAAAVRADDKKPAEPPDEKAIMEAMMKAGTPGEMHKKLEPFIGEWEFTIKMWMDPSKPPSESNGTASSTWILGGRFVREVVKGDFGGMPFEGQATTGYDNLRKTFVSTWTDNMSTCISSMTGKFDSTGKVMTTIGDEIEPLTGETIKSKSVTTFVDANTIKSEFFKMMGKQEVKVMELTYKRKK